MKLKIIGINLFILVLLSTGCISFVGKIDLDDNWQMKRSNKENIVLYYRGENYGNNSPDKEVVDTILNNQEEYYSAIQAKLNITFSDKILIYLYNYDEAEKKIGTNTGGHTISETLSIFYTYFPYQGGIQDDKWGSYYVGPHEMVHVLTHRVFGNPGTKLMSEGYAVCIDGSYGIEGTVDQVESVPIEERMAEYYNQDKVLTPTEMLNQENLKEKLFYPNSGYFIKYMFEEYGVNITNELFVLNKDEFINQFAEITGTSFSSMEDDYLQYCEENLSSS